MRLDPCPNGASVALIDDAEGFAALQAEWNDLLRDSRADSPFLTWDWLHAWWSHLRGSRGLRLFTVRRGSELIGLAPLATSRPGLRWLSRLEFLGTGYAGSDYLDVILRRGAEQDGIAALSHAFEASGLAVRFDHLPADSHAAAVAERLVGTGWTSMPSASGVCPVAALAGLSWDSFLAGLGSSHRANVRRRMRALDRAFTVRFERASTESEREQMLSTLIRLHNRRWDHRGGSTAFPTVACRAFHDEATRLALRSGTLRLQTLYLNDAPVAATYCFANNGRVYFYQGAIDEQYQQYSVGLVAMGLTIRSAIEEGAREFDLLYGVESYKWLWARDVRPLSRIELFPAHIAGRFYHRTVEAERSMRTLARRLFPRKSWNSNARPAGAAC